MMDRTSNRGPEWCLALFLWLLLPLSGSVGASSFDDLDAALDADFETLDATLEAQYQALDAALEAAYEQLQQEVAEVWGEDNIKLPDKQSWVDYSEDKQLRRVVDFEAGMVEIEIILDDQIKPLALVADLQAASASLATDSLQDLAVKDQALNYARQSMEEQGIALTPYVQDAVKPVLGKLLRELPEPAKLKMLIETALSQQAATSGKAEAKVITLENDKRKLSIKVPLSFGYKATLASRYQDEVVREAKRQAIPPSLIYAVMETESSFNPRARSPVPAFGLMQLVPRSGAMDAYMHVYGEKTLLDPEYLFDAAQNVELGAAYLNLLFTRYLRHIKDPKSREYCTIAAYNTGAGNVARSFTGKTSVKAAAKLINKLSADEVYEHLLINLPYEETRRYLKKVTKAQRKFSTMDKYLAAQP